MNGKLSSLLLESGSGSEPESKISMSEAACWWWISSPSRSRSKSPPGWLEADGLGGGPRGIRAGCFQNNQLCWHLTSQKNTGRTWQTAWTRCLHRRKWLHTKYLQLVSIWSILSSILPLISILIQCFHSFLNAFLQEDCSWYLGISDQSCDSIVAEAFQAKSKLIDQHGDLRNDWKNLSDFMPATAVGKQFLLLL